jgi:hypothetical protein
MMKRILPVGIFAGLASALLLASIGSGSVLSIALFYIAPLPIILAAIGWSHVAGIVAAGVAGLTSLVALGADMGALHLASVGLPAWWLSYLALLARAEPDGRVEWYPIGRLVLWTAAIAIVLVSLSAPLIGGSVEGYETMLRENLHTFIEAGAPGAPGDDQRDLFVEIMVAMLPPVFAAFWVVITLFNLWLAGRVTRASGRLVRPWPDLSAMILPNAALVAITIAVLAMFLPEPIGFIGRIAATTLLVALGMVGLAVLHAATRGSASRPFILAGVYALLILQIGLLLVFAVIGAAEQIFGLRTRLAQRRPPANPRSH